MFKKNGTTMQTLTSFFREIENGRIRLIYRARPHWIAFFVEFRYMLIFLALLTGFIFAAVTLKQPVDKAAFSVAFLLSVYLLVNRYLHRSFRALEGYGSPFGIFVTGRKLVAMEGRELQAEPALIELEKLEAVEIIRSPLGWALGYGSVFLKEKGKEAFYGPYRFIENPRALKTALNKLLATMELKQAS